MDGERTIARVGRRSAEQVRHLARKTRRRVGAPSNHGLLRQAGGDSDWEPLFPGLHWMTAVLFAAALVPLTFGATACLGLLLEREEESERDERARLRRRARVVERLVPRRRSRLDRIVVHV